MVQPMNVAVPADPSVTIRPLSRAAYDELIGHGHFDGERIELLEGVLVQMPPMKDPHAWAVTMLARWFIRCLKP